MQTSSRTAVDSRLALVGMWLFLAALTMLFAAGVVGWVIIRLYGTGQAADIRLPQILWLSTVVMLASSVAMQAAVRAVQRERQRALRGWLLGSSLLATLFVLIQAPALYELLRLHASERSAGLGLYGLLFFLILLHALHVVGGIVVLGRTTQQAFAGRYDHENHQGLRLTAMYWHFLDVIWVVLFAVIWVSG